MQPRPNTLALARWNSVATTVAALAKTFIPFYWIGSTAIFAAASALGMLLVLIDWRPLRDEAIRIVDVLFLLVGLYGIVIASFFVHSRPAIPFTYLLGILIFHGLFLTFGLAAARSLEAVLQVLLSAAAIYSIALIQHTFRFGDVMHGLGIDDVFGIGDWSIYITFHQNIGLVVALGALAALGLASSRIQTLVALFTLPFVLLLCFHIAARTAFIALIGSVIFWGLADCWGRSKKVTMLIAAAAIAATIAGSIVFTQRLMQDRDVNSTALDAASRTIRELHDPNPEFRLPIWTRALQEITNEPDLLLFGRGVGMYPVNKGFGPPDWLLHVTEGSKHYLHNVHLEMLYESGIAGLLLFSIVVAFPLVTSLRRWHLFSSAQRSAVSIYVFTLISSEISGNFAFSYMDQYFFALVIGIIAVKRADEVAISGSPFLKDGHFPRPTTGAETA